MMDEYSESRNTSNKIITCEYNENKRRCCVWPYVKSTLRLVTVSEGMSLDELNDHVKKTFGKKDTAEVYLFCTHDNYSLIVSINQIKNHAGYLVRFS